MASKDDDGITFHLGTELSPREIMSIGTIVSQWGYLEFEIYLQTANHHLDNIGEDLPKELENNMQFSSVLKLWKSYIVDRAEGQRREVLEKSYKQIQYLQPFRDALVHGMWDWDPKALDQVLTRRVKKGKFHTVRFTTEGLSDFARGVSALNFDVRYPGGFEEMAIEQAEEGNYMSRQFMAMITGHPVADD